MNTLTTNILNKRTKIVCTIGPASNKPQVLKKLLEAGMNVARLNFSHGKHSEHAQVINTIRAVAKKLGRAIPIIADLQGPRIRLGILPDEGLVLKNGQTIIFNTQIKKYDGERIPVTYSDLHKCVKKGERILLVDGLITTRVLSVTGRDIKVNVESGGQVFTHKGANFPDSSLTISSLSDKDRLDLAFAIKHDVDFIALSFVRDADDVAGLRKAMLRVDKKQGRLIKIICKIEQAEAIKNIERIIEATDAIMIARGDLGIEMPMEEVPILQKVLITACMKHAKPVIVATQMLESMITNPRPTRAEAADVANAVIDHADAVMLSGESAMGKYPVEAVMTMSRIIVRTEQSTYDNVQPEDIHAFLEGSLDIRHEALSDAASHLANKLKADAILVASTSGQTARLMARNRPEFLHLVATHDEKTQRQLNLSWGVRAFVMPEVKTVDELIKISISYAKRRGFVKRGDRVVILAGQPVGTPGTVNVLKVHEVE